MTIKINGKLWPAIYSLRAAMNIEDQFGGIKKALFEQSTPGEQILGRIYVLGQLLKAGKAWRELEEGEAAEEPPTEQQLLDMVSAAKSGEIMEQMIRVINDDEKSDFEAEAPDEGKNPQAT